MLEVGCSGTSEHLETAILYFYRGGIYFRMGVLDLGRCPLFPYSYQRVFL